MSPDSTPMPAPRRRPGRKVLRIAAICFGCLLIIALAAPLALQLWLTPQRTAKFFSKEASRYLDADVRVASIDWSIWTDFPWLRIQADSLTVVSRSFPEFHGMSAKDRKLLSINSLSLAINLREALNKNIVIKDISVSRPDINIVMANDSVNNFYILPKHMEKPDVNLLQLGSPHIQGPLKLAFTDKALGATALCRISDLEVTLPQTPVVEKDLLDTFRTSAVVEKLSGTVEIPDILSFMGMVPPEVRDKMPSLVATVVRESDALPLDVQFRLDAPYGFGKPGLPAATVTAEASDASLHCPLPGKKPLHVEDAYVKATVKLDPMNHGASSVILDELSFRSGKALALTISGTLSRLLDNDPALNADIHCYADMAMAGKEFLADASPSFEGKAAVTAKVECLLSGLSTPSLKKMNLDARISSPLLAVTDAAKSLHAVLKDFNTEVKASGNGNGTGTEGTFDLYAAGADVREGASSFSLHNVALALNGRLRPVPFTASQWNGPASSTEDKALREKTAHTPVWLVPALPSFAQALLTMADVSGKATIGNGSLTTPAYPGKHGFSDLKIAGNLDSLRIVSLKAYSGNMLADISGKVNDIRAFLSAGMPEPLVFDLDARFNDVDINRLAGTYYAGVAKTTGHTPDFNIPLEPPSAADSLAVLIPRNISGKFRLHTDRAEYMGYTFSPLSTELSLHDGNARIGGLRIGTPCCNALVDWTYSTADMDSIYMDLALAVEDFDFHEFTKAYPEAAAMAPELSYVGGHVSLDGNAHFLMFPDMFVNTPSLYGRFDLHGDSISISREDGKLRRYSHLAMMRGDGPLHVSGLDVTAFLHDNLLEVRPFELSVDNYTFLLGGANNLNGQMYYHAGLEKSPLHMPFGINIEGYYRHPRIRFGGKGIKEETPAKIAADLTADVHLNIMKMLRRGWLQFVAAAGKYDLENRSMLSDNE